MRRARSPEAHRLATKKARRERRWVREARRNYRQRYVTGWPDEAAEGRFLAAMERMGAFIVPTSAPPTPPALRPSVYFRGRGG
jgi:hypothetical protein